MNKRKLIKAIKDKYHYDADTGHFLRKEEWRHHYAGSVSVREHLGYINIQVAVDGQPKNMRAHRAAFLITHGYLPEVVDHINGIRSDNRIENLREATRQQNSTNQKGTFTRRGVRGLSNGKYYAIISQHPKRYILGTYDKWQEAATAYNIAARELHGEFATINAIDEVDGVTIELREIGSGAGNKISKAEKIISAVFLKTFYYEDDGSLYWLPTDGYLKNQYRLTAWEKRNMKRNQPFTVRNTHGFAGVALTRDEVVHIHKTGEMLPRQSGTTKGRKKKYDMTTPEGRFEFICAAKQLIHYDKETGKFSRDGKNIGRECKQGYVRININRSQHQAHRIAYLLTYNEWPEVVDHINNDRSDNRIKNLRAATRKNNAANRKPRRGARSKYKGVGWRPDRKKWVAVCCKKRIGLFDTEKEAAKAYDKAAKKMHGEFANLNFPSHA